MWINYSDYYLLDPFPGESFYSRLTRTVRLLNQKNFYKIMLRFYGHHNLRSNSVIAVNKFNDPFEAFIQSIAPYYMASFRLDRQKNLLKKLFVPDSNNFTGAFKTGTCNSVFKKKSQYFCPDCILEDYDRYGIPYFHLYHQYEGVSACAKHGVRLIEYKQEKFHHFQLLKLTDYQEPEPADEREILYSTWASEFKNFSFEYLNSVYKMKALENNTKLFNSKYLYKELVDFFGEDFMAKTGCSKDYLNRGNTRILDLIKCKMCSVHPFYHFMLWEYLGLTLDDFKDSVFCIIGKDLIPIEFSSELDDLELISEDLGNRIYFSKRLNRKIIEFFPINLKNYFN